MFVDASAIVALLTAEPEADALANRLEAAAQPVTSVIAVFDAVLRVCRMRHAAIAEGERDVQDLLVAAGIALVPVGAAEASGALEAFARYGKGLGHPSKLNMGGLFAYATAKAQGERLLVKSDDFSLTDLGAQGG